ncbi:VWA domain-containing protein [Granulicella arctica]|uniref:VWA domain-containing protein n=1 Tax=Granulicella arctica TaxID=940613 RepID=UPI0021E0702F|nr:VWA domain-containing protein [Granulicella arctica]
MRFLRKTSLCSLLLPLLVAQAHHVASQTDSATTQGPTSYRLNVVVDEVVVTFHAADSHGLPIRDLKLTELSFLDNGRSPRKVLAFEALQDRPVRAGILMDTSESMGPFLAGNRAIANAYAQRLLRQQTDQAFVMDFGHVSQVVQPWTNNPPALITGLRKIAASGGTHAGGTAIFDSIYRACLNQFGHVDHAASSNFILLFTDGEDNTSSVSLEDAAAECQHTNTAIYIFRADGPSAFGSTGPATLTKLAEETGGRIFHDTGSATGTDDDLAPWRQICATSTASSTSLQT